LPLGWNTKCLGAEPDGAISTGVSAGAGLRIELPDEGEIEPGIVGDDELPGRVGRDHVQVRTVMIAHRELARGIIDRAGVMMRSDARTHVRGLCERAVGRHAEYGDVAARVIGDEHPFARGVHAHVHRRRAGRADGAHARELEARGVDRIGHHRARVRALEVLDLADRIQPVLCGIERDPRGIAHIVHDLKLHESAAPALDAKKVDTAAVRRVGADIGVEESR
jgi:hypothetical protein